MTRTQMRVSEKKSIPPCNCTIYFQCLCNHIITMQLNLMNQQNRTREWYWQKNKCNKSTTDVMSVVFCIPQTSHPPWNDPDNFLNQLEQFIITCCIRQHTFNTKFHMVETRYIASSPQLKYSIHIKCSPQKIHHTYQG